MNDDTETAPTAEALETPDRIAEPGAIRLKREGEWFDRGPTGYDDGRSAVDRTDHHSYDDV